MVVNKIPWKHGIGIQKPLWPILLDGGIHQYRPWFYEYLKLLECHFWPLSLCGVRFCKCETTNFIVTITHSENMNPGPGRSLRRSIFDLAHWVESFYLNRLENIYPLRACILRRLCSAINNLEAMEFILRFFCRWKYHQVYEQDCFVGYQFYDNVVVSTAVFHHLPMVTGIVCNNINIWCHLSNEPITHIMWFWVHWRWSRSVKIFFFIVTSHVLSISLLYLSGVGDIWERGEFKSGHMYDVVARPPI